MTKCLSLLLMVALAGFFIIFYRRKINIVLLIIVAVYGVGAMSRLLALPEGDILPIALAIGGLIAIWVGTWLYLRLTGRDRDSADRPSDQSPHA